MADKFSELKKEENILAASALIEVGAMARVGVLSAGGDLTAKRARQMDRDAARIVRRGKAVRAQNLRAEAKALRDIGASLQVQKEQEQVRQLYAKEDEVILQGRATEKGMGQGGLDVQLVDADGTVLARTISAANGSFVIKPDVAPPADARIVIAKQDGATLGEIPAAYRAGRAASYLAVPVEKLNISPVRPTGPVVTPTPVTPVEPIVTPTDGPTPRDNELVEVPDLAGQGFDRAARAAIKLLAMGDVKLVKAPRDAGKVLEQSLRAGSRVPKLTPLSFVVAAGDPRGDDKLALMLLRYDRRIVPMRIATRTMNTLLRKLEVTSIDAMAALQRLPTEDVAEAMPNQDIENAKMLQVVAAGIARQFARL